MPRSSASPHDVTPSEPSMKPLLRSPQHAKYATDADHPAADVALAVEAEAEATSEFTLYPMRWVALFQLAVLNCGNAAQWVVFGIVVDQAKEDFGLATADVNLLSASYEIVFAFAGPFAMLIYDKLGLRSGLRWASLFNFIGSVLRFVSVLWVPNMAGLMVSQCFLAVTIVFTFAAPPILAARWFGDKERTMATTIGAVSNSIGLALGQLIPPLIVTPEHHGTSRWLILFAVQCSYALFEAVLIAFVIPFGPKTPPSSAEEVKGPGRAAVIAAETPDHTTGYPDSSSSDSDRIAPHVPEHGAPKRLNTAAAVDARRSFASDSRPDSRRASMVRRSTVASEVVEAHGAMDQLRALFASRPFRGLFVGMALFFGCQWSVIGLLAQIVKPMGISEATVGWMGFTQIIAGSVLAIPFSAWVDRIRVYKAPLTAMLIACTALYTLFAVVLTFQPDGMVPIAFAVYVVLGVPQACAIPVMFEYAVELTYPVDESLSGMAIIWLANVVSVPMLFGVPEIVGDPARENSALIALYLVGLISFVATVLVAVPEEHLKRLAYEKACEALARGE